MASGKINKTITKICCIAWKINYVNVGCKLYYFLDSQFLCFCLGNKWRNEEKIKKPKQISRIVRTNFTFDKKVIFFLFKILVCYQLFFTFLFVTSKYIFRNRTILNVSYEWNSTLPKSLTYWFTKESPFLNDGAFVVQNIFSRSYSCQRR